VRKSSLPTVLLVLFLDLVGFSIVFPMFAAILDWYGAADGGLLARLDDGLKSLFDFGDDPHRRAALFGGILAGLYSVIQFLVTPWWARMSDRIGRRPVLLWTVALNAAGYLVWILAGNFELFVLSRVVCAFASGNISVASAAVGDLSAKRDRAKAMGLMGAAIGLGFILGPAIGATYGLWMEGMAESLSLNPFAIPAAIAFALSAFNFWWLWHGFEESRPTSEDLPHETTRTANPLRLFRRDVDSRLPTLNLIYLLFMIGFAGFEGTLVFLLSDQLGYGPGLVGGCMVWLGFCSAMVQGGLVRRLVPKTGERRLAMAGLLVMVPGYLLCASVAWTGAAIGIWAGLTFLALGVGLLSPTLAAMVSLLGGVSSQGAAMGSYRSVGALGRALGPLLAAVLYYRLGPGAPYIFAAVLGVIPLMIFSFRVGPDVTPTAEMP